jgi:FAD/FMN-containing dehydrogenase/Fe-S oxidoreductase
VRGRNSRPFALMRLLILRFKCSVLEQFVCHRLSRIMIGALSSQRMSSLQPVRLRQVDCDVRLDNLNRQLYATDASIYQIQPAAVAFPRNAAEAGAVIRAANEDGMSVTPRGAGTSLSGGAIGDGVVVDFSRHNREIINLDLESRTVRVGAGVVLDQLNVFLKPHGFCFGPDVATSSRATLGGMIANNSSGARVPVYGTTADHVISLEIVMSDGRVEKIGGSCAGLPNEQQQIAKLVHARATEIARQMPPGMLKRWPGYGVERFLKAPNLTEILAGSEGTLAGIFSAALKISPLPREKGLGLLFFASVAEAMAATVELLDLKPAAIEHIDRPLLDQTKGQLHFQPARDLMELDSKPCQSILIIEFYDENVRERLAMVEARKIGLRRRIVTAASEMNLVWGVRKAGLSLLTGCIGSAKPVAFIEDAAVRPAQLPAYVAGLQSILQPLGLEASFYGHAATGLLHVRPVLDLHNATDLKKFRQVANETSALVRQFKGSLSAEHGVGIARTEYMEEQLGPELLELMREIKNIFDSGNVFNPGKILSDGRHRIDNHLRDNFSAPIELPFQPRLAYAFKDRSFIGNVEQCNGCGGCRKDAPMMCPTFLATGEEVMSTRGRANIIRAALQLRANGHDPLESVELDAALSNCLSCKGCTPECPSNVNLALLKAELMHVAHQRHGLPLRHRILSNVDLLGRMGCFLPSVANALLDFGPTRSLLARPLGLSPKRTLPHYALERFDRWFVKRCRGGLRPPTGADRAPLQKKVVLWDDTFVRYHEPNIGMAAVRVLEALGFEVVLPRGRQCCGRPAFSQGNLDYAAKLGEHNVALLSSLHHSGTPILFLEPSCWSMFVEDYRELNVADAEKLRARCFLFEEFVEDVLAREPNTAPFQGRPLKVAIHAHCHAKSIIKPQFMARLAERLPGRRATVLETGCCGMAGAFGMLASKYELSVQVARDLLGKIEQAQPEVVVASGTSCRHQISELSGRHPKHMAELMADALI